MIGQAKADSLSLDIDGRNRLITGGIFAPGLKAVASRGARGSDLLDLEAIHHIVPAEGMAGITIQLPGFAKGVAFWRYAPWKSWTKPMAMRHAGDLPIDDVQCAYWQYDDGLYGVALPLGGKGFRTTLGAKDGGMVTRCSAMTRTTADGRLPQVAIGFGKDLYQVFGNVFADAMDHLGTPENLRSRKTLPDSMTWLGWNTWNASDMGKRLSADWVAAQVAEMQAAGVPLGTVVLDDGHFQQRDSRLQSQAPDPVKFPGGFKPVVDSLTKAGIRHVGLWHAFDGLWNGIDPDSALGQAHKGDLFTWTQKPSPIDTSGNLVSYSFLKPDPAVLDGYFDGYYTGLKAAGISLVKVDNQLVTERMAAGGYPVWDIATAMHGAINRAAAKHFDNALINCMDMTNDAFLNFGTTAVARSVEDYFPYKPEEDYNLEHGNAAAHVLQAMYNALYFGEMVFPDFDMFESANPNAALHAAVRAANCAPIYITDQAGQHDVALLTSLVDGEGRTLRADTPLRPSPECLFQIQMPKLFKAWSRVGDGALLLLAHLADADRVEGAWSLADAADLPTGDYAAWSWRDGTARCVTGNVDVAFDRRMDFDLVRIAPIRQGRAVLGLKDKLNGLAAVKDVHAAGGDLNLETHDGGILLIWCDTAPESVTVDGKTAAFTFADHLLSLPLADGARRHRVQIA